MRLVAKTIENAVTAADRFSVDVYHSVRLASVRTTTARSTSSVYLLREHLFIGFRLIMKCAIVAYVGTHHSFVRPRDYY